MTKDKLLDIIHGYKRNEISWDSVLTAVEAYSSASNNGKPIVSGSLGFDEGYSKGYSDATKEACKEIREHYHPNDR